LYEELVRFQRDTARTGVLDDVLLNAENLPAVLGEYHLGCDQREVDGLLKILNSRGADTAGEFRRRATGRVDTIRDFYRVEAGREPKNFEVVATIAMLRGNEVADTVREVARANLAVLELSETLRDESQSDTRLQESDGNGDDGSPIPASS